MIIVMSEKNKEGIAGLIMGLEKYLYSRKLRFNMDKAKVIGFRKEIKRKNKLRARWKV